MVKAKRGRASKIDKLPDEIRAKLCILLRDKGYSQDKIRLLINAAIKDAGLDESFLISRTGLNRYASRMEEMGAKIRQAREMAEIWTKQLGERPQSDIGKLLMEFIKQMAWDKAMTLGEQADVDPKVINQLALVVNRIEQAQSLSEKREREIRKELAQKAAEAAEAIVTQAGISTETANEVKRQILGLGD